jgi:hypothetical protein
MTIYRRPFASIMLALALCIPVCAGDINSTPTSATPAPPPSAPCVATTDGNVNGSDSDCSGNVALPNANVEAATLAMDLIRSMLSMY